MKLIICADGVKRELHGSFSICGSKQDLETLNYFLGKELRERNFSYGWVDIHSQVVKEGQANTSPYDWYQEAR